MVRDRHGCLYGVVYHTGRGQHRLSSSLGRHAVRVGLYEGRAHLHGCKVALRPLAPQSPQTEIRRVLQRTAPGRRSATMAPVEELRPSARWLLPGGEARFRSYNRWLQEKFGERVYKVIVDAGFTCPNRDGTVA